MKFELVLVHNIHDRTVLGGRELRPEDVSVKDLEKVIEVEQFLERLLGKRIHINQTQ
jgi:hypothetical protein